MAVNVKKVKIIKQASSAAATTNYTITHNFSGSKDGIDSVEHNSVVKFASLLDTGYKISAEVVEDSGNVVKSVQMSLSYPSSNPVPSPNPITGLEEGETGVFSNSGLAFSSNAVGKSYTVVTKMYNASGTQVGSNQTFEVTVQNG